MALLGVVRVVAGVGSAVVWIGGTMVGVTAALVIFLGVVLVWALMAKTPAEQKYRLRLLDTFLQFLRDVFRGWGKQ